MTKRKHPSSRLINPLVGLQPLSESDQTKLSLHQHLALASVRKGNGSERDLFELVKALELLYIAVSQRPDYFVSPSSGLGNIRQMAMSVYLSIDSGRRMPEASRRWVLDEALQRDVGEALVALDDLLRHTKTFDVDVWLSTRRQSVRSGYFKCLNSGDSS
jgi:hypothetical protein